MPAANRPRGATAIRAEQSSLAQISLPQINLKRGHIMAGLVITGCIAIAFGLSGNKEQAIEPAIEAELPVAIEAPATDAAPVDTFAIDTAPEEQLWNEQAVRTGDNLSLIFKRAGFDNRDVHRVVSESEHGKGLARIYPGQTIAFQASESGELAVVRHIKSELETVTYTLDEGGFQSQIDTRVPETRSAAATGVITSSLFMAGQEAGLSQSTIMDMANIFGGVIDFVGDPRKGDTMHLVFEELIFQNILMQELLQIMSALLMKKP